MEKEDSEESAWPYQRLLPRGKTKVTWGIGAKITTKKNGDILGWGEHDAHIEVWCVGVGKNAWAVPCGRS